MRHSNCVVDSFYLIRYLKVSNTTICFVTTSNVFQFQSFLVLTVHPETNLAAQLCLRIKLSLQESSNTTKKKYFEKTLFQFFRKKIIKRGQYTFHIVNYKSKNLTAFNGKVT